MFSAQDDGRLLALGANPDRDLLDLIKAWYPTAELECQPGPMATWLDSLWTQPPRGLVVFSEGLPPADLKALAAWLSPRKSIPVLLLSGPRGLIGAEELLCHPSLKIMPGPWSPAGLRQLLRQQLAPESPRMEGSNSATTHETPSRTADATAEQLHTAAPQSRAAPTEARTATSENSQAHQDFNPEVFDGDFIDGLIERFRDPLASLSGYLQLLHGSVGSPEQLVNPALAAAREIESALEVLHLASDTCALHPSRLSGEHMAIEALKEAQRSGLSVQLNLENDFLVRADGRLVRAALQCARVQLSRFGGTAEAELVLRCEHSSDTASLIWELVEASHPSRNGGVVPPNFLPLLLERFATLVGAQSVLRNGPGGEPRQVGLAWPDSATLQPAL